MMTFSLGAVDWEFHNVRECPTTVRLSRAWDFVHAITFFRQMLISSDWSHGLWQWTVADGKPVVPGKSDQPIPTSRKVATKVAAKEEAVETNQRSAAEYYRQQIPGLLKEAESLYAQGRYHEAAEHFQKAEYRRRQLADTVAKLQLERIEPKAEAKGAKVAFRIPRLDNEPLQTIWQSGLMDQLLECGAIVTFRFAKSRSRRVRR